jgi:PTS system galactitol-specific IIC component
MIFGIIAGVKPLKSIKSGLLFGFGFWLINLILGAFNSAIIPMVAGLAAVFGIEKPIISSYVVMIGSWGHPLHALGVALSIGLNIVFLLLGLTSTLIVDFLNACAFPLMGLYAYYFSGGNFIWYLVMLVISLFYTLKTADWAAPKIREVYEGFPEGIVPLHFWSNASFLLGYPLVRLIESIPGLKDIKLDVATLQEKLGEVFDASFVSFLFVLIVNLLVLWPDFNSILANSIIVGAGVYTLPKAVAIFVEGTAPIAAAVRSKLVGRARFKDVLIGIDAAVALGYPEAVLTCVLTLMFTVILSVFMPFVGMIPMTFFSMAADQDYLPVFSKKNIFSATLAGVIMAIFTLWLATFSAPFVTEAVVSWGNTPPPAGSYYGLEVISINLFNLIPLIGTGKLFG